MTKQELDELIEKLDSMSYVYHDMTFWHILGMRDVLKTLRKDPNTAKTMTTVIVVFNSILSIPRTCLKIFIN